MSPALPPPDSMESSRPGSASGEREPEKVVLMSKTTSMALAEARLMFFTLDSVLGMLALLMISPFTS